MVVSRTLVEPNAFFVDMVLEASFARSMAAIATFSEDRTPSFPFGGWDPESPLIDIVEI